MSRPLAAAGLIAVLALLGACARTEERRTVGTADTAAVGSSPSRPAPPAEEPPAPPAGTGDLVRVASPTPGQVVRSPLVVRGEARGPWYFEASFPVRIVDGSGRVLDETPAQAQGEWMTREFVPFVATLTFRADSGSGRLVLEKQNASGLPEHADSVVIPVRFR